MSVWLSQIHQEEWMAISNWTKKRRVLRESTTIGERKDNVENVAIETMAVELKEDDGLEAEIIDRESYERTEEDISISKEVIAILTSGERNFHMRF